MLLELAALGRLSCIILVKKNLWVWVNCRSGGQRGDGPRGLPFPPLQLLLRSHYTLHSQTSNSLPEPTSVCPDSQCCYTRTHTQTHKDAETCTQQYNHFTNFYGTWHKGHFFMIWWPVTTFPLSTTAPNIQEICIQLATTQSQGLWVFSYGYKWVVRLSVHLLLLRVKSTALGVIH